MKSTCRWEGDQAALFPVKETSLFQQRKSRSDESLSNWDLVYMQISVVTKQKETRAQEWHRKYDAKQNSLQSNVWGLFWSGLAFHNKSVIYVDTIWKICLRVSLAFCKLSYVQEGSVFSQNRDQKGVCAYMLISLEDLNIRVKSVVVQVFLLTPTNLRTIGT